MVSSPTGEDLGAHHSKSSIFPPRRGRRIQPACPDLHSGHRVSGNRVDLPGHDPRASGGAIYADNAQTYIANTAFIGNRAGYVFIERSVFKSATSNPSPEPRSAASVEPWSLCMSIST